MSKRSDDDTIRTTLHEVGSQAQIDLTEAQELLKAAAESSTDAAHSLLMESRRTRMASRPGMKRPFIK